MAINQSINQYSRTIAVLPNLEAIGQAVDQLVLSGFPLAQIFLVGQAAAISSHTKPVRAGVAALKELLHEATLETITGSTTTLERGIIVGNFTGGITGLLVGVGLLTIPGVAATVLGSVFLYLLSIVGIGSLAGGAVGAIVGHGITRQLARNYAAQVFQGNYLLVISGSEADIFRAEHILYVRGTQPQQWS